MKSDGDYYSIKELKNSNIKRIIDRTIGFYIVCIGSDNGGWSAELLCNKLGSAINENKHWIQKCNENPSDGRARLNICDAIHKTIQSCAGMIYREASKEKNKFNSSTSLDLFLNLPDYAIIYHAGTNKVYEVISGRNCLNEDKNKSIIGYNIGMTPFAEFNFFPTKLSGGEVFVVAPNEVDDLNDIKRKLLKKSQLFFSRATAFEMGEQIYELTLNKNILPNTGVLIVTVGGKKNITHQTKYEEEIEILRKLPIFHFIKHDDECIKQLHSIIVAKIYQLNQEINAEQSPSNELYILLKGHVVGKKNGVEASKVREGETFAEMSFFRDIPRSLQSVVTSERAEILVIQKEQLKTLYQMNPGLELSLYKGALESAAIKHGDQATEVVKLKSANNPRSQK